jgi:tRNA U38,U39,U40 pseudouridine synthase TruA
MEATPPAPRRFRLDLAYDGRPFAGWQSQPGGGSVQDALEAALAATSARRQAEGVMRSLGNMGLPPQRMTLSSTTSAQAQNTEVHLFVR